MRQKQLKGVKQKWHSRIFIHFRDIYIYIYEKLIHANLWQNCVYMSYTRLYSYPEWFAKPNSNKKECLQFKLHLLCCIKKNGRVHMVQFLG
jgi:hypothetical protein